MRRLVRMARRFLRVLVGRDFYPGIDLRCPIRRFGSAYGGWNIVADRINKQSVVYSFGVGEDASFDNDLIDQPGVTVHAFDPTPKSIDWVKQQGFPDAFVMHEYGLADHDGEVTFCPPENPEHVSHTLLDRRSTNDRAISVPVKSLATIMAELGHERIDLMKMDIEGAEYQVIQYLADSTIRPVQLLVEFHHRFPEIGLEPTRQAVHTLKLLGYRLFSVSATGEEYCFILASEAPV